MSRISMAGPAGAVADADLAPAVRDERARRMLTERPLGELGQVGVALVLGGAFWGTPAASRALPWVGAVLALAVLRLLGRLRLGGGPAAPPRAAGPKTGVVLAGAGVWGVGPLLLAPIVPFEQYALLVLTFVGLVAGATATLAADRRAFYGFGLLLCGPLALGLVVGGLDRTSVVTLMLVILFAGMMGALFERAHEGLLLRIGAAEQATRREAEAARGREYLDALLASAPTAIATVGAGGRVLGVNPAFESLFGYRADQAVGRVLDELVVPEAERARARALEQRAWDGQRVVTEVERQRRDGRLVPVRVSAARVVGSVGAETLFVLYDDITANRSAERALREAERQYRDLVETSTDLVWEVDRDGRWVFLNEAGQEIYGAAPEDLLGRPFADRVEPEHLAADRAAFQQVLAGGDLVDYETLHRDIHGVRKHLSFSARPVRDGTGMITGAHGTARDVTARAEARAALEEARAVAERTAEVRAAFVANMSHEIRTPMNGVLGLVELLLDSELTQEQRRSAELLRTSGEALLAVIDDVLDFSKVEAGHLELESVPFDLHSLVEGTVALLAPRAAQRDLEVVADLAADLPRGVRGDPGRLRQVLNNLIGNAIKFTHQGEVVVTVRPEPAAPPGVRFAVTDSGIGIPADRLEAVFGEFTQVDASTTRRYGGTGLGLAISQRLVRLMGGDIAVQSAVGQGSEFSFVIPLADAPEGTVAAARPVAFQGERCLVVDDNGANRRIVREMLKVAGLVVDEADSAAQGVAILRAAAGRGEPYGLAVIDSQMPDRDGFELAADVRADQTLAGVRLLMLTSAGRRGDAQRCRDAGVDGYLHKPVGRVELLEAIASVLGHEGGVGATLVTRHSLQESRRRLRVLLAEDNPVNQQVALALLQRRGHDVAVVENGRLALEAVQRERFDVVLMDVQMPEMDGLAATRAIRALPSGGEVPIVAVTAHALASEGARCLEAGMTAWVVKPYRPHELIAAVEGWGLGEPVPEAPAEGERPAVDLAGLRRSLDDAGAGDAMGALVGAFVGDAPARMRDVEAAVAAADATGIARAAHAYKSAAGTIGAMSLADLLRRLEAAGKAGNVPQAQGLLADVGAAHTAALAYLEHERVS